MRKHGKNLNKGHTVKAGGVLTVGQEQDTVGSKFDANQSFQGYLTNVNVWSRVLSPGAIARLSKNCLSSETEEVGDVYVWVNFLYGIKGRTGVVIPSPCSPQHQ